MTVENSTLNRDSTFNRTVCLIESTEYAGGAVNQNKRLLPEKMSLPINDLS